MSRASMLRIVVAITLVTGCALERTAIAPTQSDAASPDAGPADAGTGDAGPADAGLGDGGPCEAEACNGLDDDCDGEIDEDFDLSADPLNCGTCGYECSSGPGASAACEASACTLECTSGLADCDLEPTTGCEADLATSTSCGSCEVVCTDPTPLCADDGGGLRCVDACPGTSELCGTSCVDLTSDPLHCSDCAIACPLRDHATASCTDSDCGFTCAAEYGDCDLIETSGCETSLRTLTDCAACGVPCAFAHASATCATGTCEQGACDAGYSDCDVMTAGCETDVRTLVDCGGCGVSCAPPGSASASCATGTCAIAACLPGLGDCDLDATSGCEADLSTDDAHCGSCARSCAPTERCADGVCVDPSDVVEVTAGRDFSCARVGDGRVFCWGVRANGRLGDGLITGSSTSAVPVVGLTDATAITAGTDHACAIRGTGRVACWGRNNQNQAGPGADPLLALNAIPGIDDAVWIRAAFEHTCVVRRAGTVACWGRNSRTGGGGGASGTPRDIAGITGATRVATGADHTCVRMAGGAVSCWGSDNNEGQIGNGTTTTSALPVAVLALLDGSALDAIELSAGTEFTCAVRAPGSAACWGRNGAGQVGDASTTRRTRPTQTLRIADAVRTSSGEEHTCIVRSGGGVQCWGSGANYRLGNADSNNQTTPIDITLAAAARDVAAGATHTCVALASGAVSCWGTTPGNGAATELQTPSATNIAGLP